MARFLNEHACSFLFGNTAADVQVVSGQTRQETHFFEMPLRLEAMQPWRQMLFAHPQLACPQRLPAEQAAFLAGYLCHLQADWLWITDIYSPVFGPGRDWGTFPQRLYLHNVLRSYLDRQILLDLAPNTQDCLASVNPDRWLPFAEDRALRAWRDLLAPQLLPGAAVQTVEVFAARQGISAAEYYALLDSQERMQREIFSLLSLSEVEAYRQRLIRENLKLLDEYMAGNLLSPERQPSIAANRGRRQTWQANVEANRYESD